MSFAIPMITAALPYATAGATLLSGYSQMQNASYQSAVASQNANLLEQQAQREAFAASQDMADTDASARAQIAGLMAEMDASGLNSTTGSMLFRRAGMESLATRDRERLSQKRDIALENTRQSAAGQRAESKAMKRSGKYSLLSTALSVPTSFLSSASMVNEYNKGRMTLSSPSYSRR